ncbi:transcriptional activator AdeR [Paenibacillus baekrokdamisoli]|uniref:Transcriptional activator AdeR n=1 Tax=Paenibacillus baekrokdamisoli TaxID=1712516 RepID=A0A3G9ITU2_9BACL|nr:PucR family transcriptional regulator [Paenibacillus baekrokdamisoli]MBB3070768.1 DNA-binding PucR family transcriptional regulator [Paenibacillus baekrokdamisoli]BBH22290.1 transcriptional activator AdeR [Paenibacillus baekrokdamisoli]
MKNEKDPFDRSFDSLEALVDTISEVLHCPVTIEDANHRLIAYSSHDPQTDPARIATIIGRRVPEKVISSLWRDGIIQQLMQSNESVRVSAIHDIGLGDRLAIAIRKNNEILGYIWVLEVDEKLNDDATNQLKKAAEAAKTKLLQLQMQKRKEEQGFQDFFWQLLTGHLKSNAMIKERAEKLGAILPASFHVIVLQFEAPINEKLHQQIQYMITTSQRIRIFCHVIDQNQLILLSTPLPQLFSKEDYTEAFVQLLNQMKNRFGLSPIKGGSGTLYADYAMVEKSYQEALTVLKIKKQFPDETKSIHYYPDLGYYRFLPLIMEEKRAHHYQNECLHKLKQYDYEHNSNLLHTLETYLCNDSNIKIASDVLHVHTNTLNYRLKRISEIGGVDLNNMDQKVTLYLEMKTEKLGIYPTNE